MSSDRNHEQRARELLAAEYEREGMPVSAQDCLCGSRWVEPAVRAITAARRSRVGLKWLVIRQHDSKEERRCTHT